MYPIKKWGWPVPRQIVVFRALKLGDMLHAVPAFRALKTAFSNSRITLIGLPWAEDFVRRFPCYLDDFISFPGFPGLPEQVPDLPRLLSFLKEIQTRNVDLAIQMQGSGSIANPLIGLLGAKQTAGFYLEGQYCPDEDWFLEYPAHESEAWRHLRLMKFLGIPLQGDELEFPLFEEDRRELEQIMQNVVWKRDYICMHPGASRPERRWPVENFAAVADGLAALGFQVVLTGTQAESELTAALTQEMKTPAIDLAGKTSLGSLAALLSNARLLVSNDTGVAHVATALQMPSLILFAVPDMDSWAPKNRQLHRVLWPSLTMTAAEVLAEAEDQLQRVYARTGC